MTPDVKSCEPIVSPKGEICFVTRYGQNHWMYPNWELDLSEKEELLVKVGYLQIIHMREPMPKTIERKERGGMFNWEIGDYLERSLRRPERAPPSLDSPRQGDMVSLDPHIKQRGPTGIPVGPRCLLPGSGGRRSPRRVQGRALVLFRNRDWTEASGERTKRECLRSAVGTAPDRWGRRPGNHRGTTGRT